MKHSIKYGRIQSALDGIGYLEASMYQADDAITVLEKNADQLPMDLYYDRVVSEDDLQDSRSELDSSIWFVSLLSRIDGAVSLDFDLSVLGFGVEILTTTAPTFIYRATDAVGSKRRIHKVDYQHFGTRHRSMMRYCASHPGSIGFVIFQDGDARAITSDRGRVLLWDDIKLQLDFRSSHSR